MESPEGNFKLIGYLIYCMPLILFNSKPKKLVVHFRKQRKMNEQKNRIQKQRL